MKVLVIVTVWPEPESSAAGWRVLNVIDSCKSAGWDVTVSSPSVLNAFSEKLLTLGVKVQPLALNDSAVDPWLADQAFDIAILDRFIVEEQFGWRLAEHSPKTLRVLDTEDLHFLRRSRRSEHEKQPDHIENQYREIASIYRSDLTLLISDFEKSLLEKDFSIPAELLHLFRFCYKDLPPTAGYEERAHFVAIGNFRHPPNADATVWMKKEIWPEIKKQLPKVELHIYGAYPSREMMDLSSPQEGFIVKGPTPDAHETLRKYRVNLAPLRFGAGIKGKISDGWRAGTPVVTTKIGAEGMGIENEAENTVDKIVKKAVELYTNENAWRSAREQGEEILRSYFDFDRNSKDLIERMQFAYLNREEGRKKNFTGQMLAYHSMRGAKYFSRWIELKESGQKNNDQARPL